MRLATVHDIPRLRAVMDASIGELQQSFLSAAQVAASFALMGLDTQLIRDRTYFVVELDGAVAGCGGWSRRATLFGGDQTGGREARLLDPAREAARVRAMYTHPAFARRGIGRAVLAACEDAARAAGFARVELAATLAGVPLHRACGYGDEQPFDADTPSGVRVPLVRMSKTL